MKARYPLLILIAIILVIGYFYSSNNRNITRSNSLTTQEDNLPIDIYFSKKLTEKIGQTYEGYDADIIMFNFPGMEQSDFNNVKTTDGIYSYTSDELAFNMDESKPESSASKTITDYKTLLENISIRLKIPANNNEGVDRIIVQVLK